MTVEAAVIRSLIAHSDETRHRFQSKVGHTFQRKPCHPFQPKPATGDGVIPNVIAFIFKTWRGVARYLYLRRQSNYHLKMFINSRRRTWRYGWHCRYSNRLDRLVHGRSPWQDG